MLIRTGTQCSSPSLQWMHALRKSGAFVHILPVLLYTCQLVGYRWVYWCCAGGPVRCLGPNAQFGPAKLSYCNDSALPHGGSLSHSCSKILQVWSWLRASCRSLLVTGTYQVVQGTAPCSKASDFKEGLGFTYQLRQDLVLDHCLCKVIAVVGQAPQSHGSRLLDAAYAHVSSSASCTCAPPQTCSSNALPWHSVQQQRSQQG